MGGLRRLMPVTFATYAVGMMALSGFPLVFSGFWSKDEILHAALVWSPSRLPFLLGLFGAVLTAFYMTRQMWYVFFAPRSHPAPVPTDHDPASEGAPHESPPVMTVPLGILAAMTILLSLLSTPAWPWFHAYLGGHLDRLKLGRGWDASALAAMGLSVIAVALGVGTSWNLHRRSTPGSDPLEVRVPRLFRVLERRLFVDEFYAATVFRLNRLVAVLCDGIDRQVWGSLILLVTGLTRVLAWLGRNFDEEGINSGFDTGCAGTRGLGRLAALLQNGQAQRYLRVLGIGVVALVATLAWMGRK